MNNSISQRHRLSTRLAFLTVGFSTSAWAPLVPYAKERLALGDGPLGLLLLCLGAGSLMAMPLTGALTARYGCRAVILWSALVVCLALPGLALAPKPLLLGLALFCFGAALGTMDVAMNVQAVLVEKAGGGALMSGFHGMYSLGGFAGAGSMALLLWLGSEPAGACLAIVAVAALLLWRAAPDLLHEPEARSGDSPAFALPHGAVIFIGALCFIVFLAEGAMLDWSAVFLTAERGLEEGRAGLGYAAFAVAMTVGRLTGDRVVSRFGGRWVLLAGGLCAAAGFFAAVASPTPGAALCGFVLVGLGASNIVPVLFTAAGNQQAMPASLAIAAITTIGYAGILAGPALIGVMAHLSSLELAFAALGAGLLLVAASSRLVRVHS
ncbi:MFS transporter [Pseudoduganella violaceinigra]|uniref:MFS transporter n=1 Tax=Pseudoduganella violaceinigra TaxID=246602 RepID=UPI000428E43B|nr:MFS transporter [Pseudoduganella violaceinigra]